MADITQLRSKLAELDKRVLELIAERQKLVSEIGQYKLEAGIATRDYQQEAKVIRRARKEADKYGLPGQLAEDLMLLLIRTSLTAQEQDRVTAQGEGSGKRVLVIGGSGQMGSWLVRFLASQGFAVEIADPREGPAGFVHYNDWHEAELSHDMIIVAAPLSTSNEILLELAKDPPPGLIFDVGSLKSPLRKGLKALVAAGANVTSLHPMFGPNTELLSGRHVIFVDLGVKDATEQARELFSSTMAVQVDMELEDHDRLIAYVLGLSHALNIAFFTALAESGEAAPKLATLSSTTFDAQLNVASLVAKESPTLYFEIQSLNDYGTESLSALLYAVERLRSVVRAGDETGFTALMNTGRQYLTDRTDREK